MDAILQMMTEMREDIRRLEDKVDELRADYWKRVGGMIVISAMVALSCEVAARIAFK